MKKDSDTPRICEFCRFASEIRATEDMLCTHRGVVDKEYTCRKFIYDPLKRVPRALPELVSLEDI
ncbi:MAG: hypothetical protein IJ428_00565 [Clostridia bacterium]|nr:hypothetical protein [Clostridia bacterium]